MAARQWMSRALGVIGLTALATGCADDGVSFHVRCPIAPTIDEDSCVYDPGSELCVADGVLNLQAASSYRLNLAVESGLKSRMRDVPLLAETNGMQVRGADVELRVSNGDLIDFSPLANPLTVSASGYLDPQGQSVIPVTIFGKEYVDKMIQFTALSQVVAAVKLKGLTNGGEEVESGEFLWPIRLIRASPLKVDNQCRSITFCISGFGQDSFAQACRDSATTN